MDIAIVTDSTSDISPALADRHRIEVVPNLLMVENQTYLDGRGLSRDEFYANLSSYSIPPTTGAPSIAVYQQVYEGLLNSGCSKIVSIHPSSALSALYSVASVAAQSFKDKITVIDSDQVSMGLGFQVIAAAEAAAQGATVQEIIQQLEQIRKRVRVIALLDTLEHVRHSGRVHWVTAALGSMLGLKALIEVKKGIVHRLGLSRTRRGAVEMLIKHIINMGPLERFAILHTTVPDQNEVQAVIKGVVRMACEPLILPMTTVIGTHVGPKCLGFAAVSA